MGFLDFLTQPRRSVMEPEPETIQPMVSPRTIDDNGLLSGPVMGPPQQMQGPPQVQEKPSLLSGLWDYLKSPQNLAAVGAGLKGLSGDDSGVQQAMEIGEQRRAETQRNAKEAKAQTDLARKNAAFKAAYVQGPDGKRRFDPSKYIDALGGEGDVSDVFDIATKLAPQGGVSGDTLWNRDPVTGDMGWGDQRDPSHSEQQAEERAAEIERHNREMERLGLMNHATSDFSAHRPRVGRGGGNVPSLPPGFVIEK